MDMLEKLSFLRIWVALRRAILRNGLRFTLSNLTQTRNQSLTRKLFQQTR